MFYSYATQPESLSRVQRSVQTTNGQALIFLYSFYNSAKRIIATEQNVFNELLTDRQIYKTYILRYVFIHINTCIPLILVSLRVIMPVNRF